MFKKIIEPLKIPLTAAAVAALIFLGFQLGKSTNDGLITHLKEQNLKLTTRLETVGAEKTALLLEQARNKADAAEKKIKMETSKTAEATGVQAEKVEEKPIQPVANYQPQPAAINQISETFTESPTTTVQPADTDSQ